MKTYLIKRKKAFLDWNSIPAVMLEHTPWLTPCDISATAQLCYDDNALYVRMCARESPIRAEFTGLLDQPCLDSCLEFFVSPMPDEQRYINIEYNPNGCLYLGISTGDHDLYRLIKDNDNTEFLCPKITLTEDGWEITYRIPLKFFRLFFPDFSLESGRKMRANFFKCGEYTVQRHYLAWNPTTSDTPNFHRPCDFGEVVFE